MIVPDANLLLYAYDTTSPHHQAAAEWWEATMSGTETVGLTHQVVFAFVRIATSARVYTHPLTVAEAAAIVESWTERTVTRVLRAGPDHVAAVLTLLATAGSSGGNLVTDAQIAALAREHRGVVHTADHDFRRFAEVRLHYPLTRR